MEALLREGLRAGGLGFSSTWSTSHNDHTGSPVPSRVADPRGAAGAVRRGRRAPRAPRSSSSPRWASCGRTRSTLMADMSRSGQPPAQLELHPGVRAEQGVRATTSSPGGDYAAEPRWPRRGPHPARQLPHAPELRVGLRARHPPRLGQADGAARTTRSCAMLRQPRRPCSDGRAGPEPGRRRARPRQLGRLLPGRDLLRRAQTVHGPPDRRDRPGARHARRGTRCATSSWPTT